MLGGAAALFVWFKGKVGLRRAATQSLHPFVEVSACDPVAAQRIMGKGRWMGGATLTPFDLTVRGELTRTIAELGHAPANESLAQLLGVPLPTIEQALRRLHDAHALLLHPHCCVPWVVHPFALSPGSCWVQSRDRGWWANCLYCGMGIAAALQRETTIHTRIGGEHEPVVIHIHDGQLQETALIFHLSTPVSAWWDNVIHACASFQPFHSETDVDAWCDRHALPRGAIVPLSSMWAFATDWYGDYLRKPWLKRSTDEAEALFLKHGFTGKFWQIS